KVVHKQVGVPGERPEGPVKDKDAVVANRILALTVSQHVPLVVAVENGHGPLRDTYTPEQCLHSVSGEIPDQALGGLDSDVEVQHGRGEPVNSALAEERQATRR